MFLWILLVTFSSHAIDVLKLKKVYIENHWFTSPPRIATIFPYRAVSEVSLGVDATLLGPLYLRTLVHSLSDDSQQVRHVGLKFEAGVQVWRIEAGYLHHSQHILEGQSPLFRFPVRDDVFIRLILLDQK